MAGSILEINFPTEQLMAWVEKAKGLPLQFAVEFLQDMNEAVVYATPYVTGNLRGHWYAGIGSEPDAKGGSPDAGGAAVARMNVALAALQLGDVYFAVNGASYGPFVEFGTSHMEPRAFVRGAVDRAPEIAEAAAARIAAEQ